MGVHLIELVNAAAAMVAHHQRARLEGKVTRGKERVGRFAHGTANYSPWTISGSDLILNELGYVINTISVGDGRAAKLHCHVNFLRTDRRENSGGVSLWIRVAYK